MKLIFKYCFVLFLITGRLAAQSVVAEISVVNSNCNGSNNGRAEIHVTEVNPPYTFLWNFGSEQKVISGLAPGNYSVVISDGEGNDTTISITIAETPCVITPANIFTPNNDSFYDTWQIQNIDYYPDNLILVFNRWGQKVYESKGMYIPWDGKDFLNIPVPDNSYYYIIYGDKNDNKSIVKGTVSIIR